MELIAVDRPQLEAAHQQMLEWSERQLATLKDEGHGPRRIYCADHRRYRTRRQQRRERAA